MSASSSIFLLAGHNPRAEHSEIYTAVVGKIRRYLGTKVITSAAVGVLVWASLAIIGLELAGVFGVLAFLVNFIPAIGPIIVTVLPIPLALAQFQSLGPVILVVVVPGVIHNIIGNIIEPKLMGEGLDLHPVTIVLALSFWGLLWGIVGMFLAAPITAAIRIVLMQFDTFKPHRESAGRRLLQQGSGGQGSGDRTDRGFADSWFNSSKRNRACRSSSRMIVSRMASLAGSRAKSFRPP